MITRKGKIARLPNHIRETLNLRLQDGVTGASIVEWLNSLHEVQQILLEHFESRPINEQNLSEWKQGGFREWQQEEDARVTAQRFTGHSDFLKEALGSRRPVSSLGPELAVTLWRVSRQAAEGALASELDQKCLFRVADRIIGLQRAEQQEEKLQLERERLAFEKERYHDSTAKSLPKTYVAAFETLRDCLAASGFTEEEASNAMGALCAYFELMRHAPHHIPPIPPVPPPPAPGANQARSNQIKVETMPNLQPDPDGDATGGAKSNQIKPRPEPAATLAPVTLAHSPSRDLPPAQSVPPLPPGENPGKSNQIQVETHQGYTNGHALEHIGGEANSGFFNLNSSHPSGSAMAATTRDQG